MTVPLSILDLSPISEGSDAATALRNTVDLAQHAEQWGYKRYWIAEHHFVAVASSSARGADRPDRRRHRTHSRRCGRRPTRAHHRRRGRRELRHARRFLSRPHRPRRRPVGSTPPRGGSRSRRRSRNPSATCRRNGATSTAWSCRRRSTCDRIMRDPRCARRCRSCSSPTPSRRTSPIRSTTSSPCCDGCYRSRWTTTYTPCPANESA